jgi:hypothetical protein
MLGSGKRTPVNNHLAALSISRKYFLSKSSRFCTFKEIACPGICFDAKSVQNAENLFLFWEP